PGGPGASAKCKQQWRYTMRAWLAGLALLAAFLTITAAGAGDKKGPPKKKANPAYRDPDNADADFAIQGEYRAEDPADKSKNLAAQVIARGDGQFDVNILPGGLPGDGWDGKTKIQAKAKTENGKTTVSGKGVGGTLTGGKLELMFDKGQRTLAKV